MNATKPRRRALRHAQVHLPPLDAGYALTLAGIFERAIAALWRAHGEGMAQLLELRAANRRAPAREPERADGDRGVSDDDLF